jgi:hypothetical protein
MNDVEKYIRSINRLPHVNGKQISMAKFCKSYGEPSWYIKFHKGGYIHLSNPTFTDEDGLNAATTIVDYAHNLGYADS